MQGHIDETEVEHEDGEQWTNVFNGRVYKYSAKDKKWVWTGETVPVPFLGEFP